jgi:hypothetical protein
LRQLFLVAILAACVWVIFSAANSKPSPAAQPKLNLGIKASKEEKGASRTGVAQASSKAGAMADQTRSTWRDLLEKQRTAVMLSAGVVGAVALWQLIGPRRRT